MNKAAILVIDDEPQIQKLLNILLEEDNYKVLKGTTGKEGIVMAASHMPDVILLDLGLPDKSGHEVLRELKSWYSKPIIILSVQNSEEDIIKALDNGAADYLTKPFRAGELLARLRSVLRRMITNTAEPVQNFGSICIDMASHKVLKNNQPVKLTATEYKLLQLFAANEGRALTHQFILKEIWGVGHQTETQYLRVFVAQLRKKIEDDPNHPQHIITESGIGYRFV